MKEEYPKIITKANIVISNKKELVKYVWIFTLGDGCLRLAKSKDRPNKDINAHFECNQVQVNEDYILWRADILSNITSVNLRYREISGCQDQISTKTRRHPLYTMLRNRTYLNNRKTVNPHDLKLLDWESLAILYQDDGCLSKKPNGNNCYTLSLSTDCFSYGDNVLLQRAIKDKTDILFRINSVRSKGGLHYKLILSKYDEINRFLDGIKTFIKPSFEYKLLSGIQYPNYTRIKVDRCDVCGRELRNNSRKTTIRSDFKCFKCVKLDNEIV